MKLKVVNPSTRLLTILELLQAREKISGPELARRLEVSPRTVRRYIMMLQDMGVPIESERGRYGQYRLREGFKLPPLMFSEQEALALVLGLLLVARSGGLVEASVTEGAKAKIERVLPEALREQINPLQQALVLEPPLSARTYGEPVLHTLAILAKAHQEKRCVDMHYRNASLDATLRRVAPYAVVQCNNLWNLVGYCFLRQELRIFRVDRIDAISLSDETFALPEDFDAAQYLRRSFAHISSTYEAAVLLKTDLDTARAELGANMVHLEETEGGVLLSCTTDDLRWLARLLSGLELSWQVRYPAELKGEIVAYAQALAAKVQGAPAG